MYKTDDEVQPAACFVLREDEATSGTKPGKIPGRVSKLSREVVVASTGPPARERERNIYVTLGSGTYVLMCAAFMAGMEGSFKVSCMRERKDRPIAAECARRNHPAALTRCLTIALEWVKRPE